MDHSNFRLDCHGFSGEEMLEACHWNLLEDLQLHAPSESFIIVTMEKTLGGYRGELRVNTSRNVLSAESMAQDLDELILSLFEDTNDLFKRWRSERTLSSQGEGQRDFRPLVKKGSSASQPPLGA